MFLFTCGDDVTQRNIRPVIIRENSRTNILKQNAGAGLKEENIWLTNPVKYRYHPPNYQSSAAFRRNVNTIRVRDKVQYFKYAENNIPTVLLTIRVLISK